MSPLFLPKSVFQYQEEEAERKHCRMLKGIFVAAMVLSIAILVVMALV